MNYKDLISSIKGYQEVWCTLDGCVKLQHSYVTDQDKGVPHNAVFDTYTVKA